MAQSTSDPQVPAQCRREGDEALPRRARSASPTSAPVERRSLRRPASTASKSGSRMSDYGLQLREKQKVRRIYGVLERQFRKLLRRGRAPQGRHRREPAAAARVAPRQRGLPHGLRRLAHRSAPAGAPQRHPGQRQARQHSVVPGAPGRRRSRCASKAKEQLRIKAARRSRRVSAASRSGSRSTPRR